MFYIIETGEQLHRLDPTEECYIEVISNNDNFHPAISTVSLVYYRADDKGYILAVNHSETFSLSFYDIQQFISKHDKVYCLDQKYTSYFLTHPNLIDINFSIIDIEGSLVIHECNTKVHVDYYITTQYLKNVNEVIPVAKHYEKCERLYEKIKQYIGKEQNQEFYREYCKQYAFIEREGLSVDEAQFRKYFEPTWLPYSVEHNTAYTYYNLYNLTTRPTNSFNSINFLALNKEDGSRKSFVPKNDMFIEFDFDAYHLKLIANLIGYEFEKGKSIHTILGEQYFNTKELTEQEYGESKVITFQQIYGGIRKEYAHIEFFKKISDYIQATWKIYQETGKIVLKTGRPLYLHKNSLNPQKLFNYIVQNLETWQNVVFLKELNKLVEHTHSKMVLVVYDSFLLDFSLKDGKKLLLSIKKLVNTHGFNVKVKIGNNYDSLQKTSYL